MFWKIGVLNSKCSKGVGLRVCQGSGEPYLLSLIPLLFPDHSLWHDSHTNCALHLPV